MIVFLIKNSKDLLNSNFFSIKVKKQLYKFMKQIEKFIILILLVNPFQTHKTNMFNEYDLIGFYLQINCGENFYSNSDDVKPAIRVNTNDIPKDQSLDDENNIDAYDEETRLASNIKDNLFLKPGSSYSEKADARGRHDSKTNSTLIFRQKTKSSGGKKQPYKGTSDPTHPANLQNFEKVGIPIDPMKDPRKKTDDYNNWRWSTSQTKWIRQDINYTDFIFNRPILCICYCLY